MNPQIVANLAQAIDNVIDNLVEIKKFAKVQLEQFVKQQEELKKKDEDKNDKE